MSLPTFLVIGTQRGATTTLYHWLGQHPEIFLPDQKETNFFLDEGAWHEGIGWYKSMYLDGSEHRHRGDVSPGYTMFPQYRHAPERAAEVVPDARLIYVIREPVGRMVSAWRLLVGGGFESRDLVDALLQEAHYALASMYGLQIERWLRYFDRDSLLVVRTEDLTQDGGRTLDRLLAHLDLEPGWRPEDMDRAWNRGDDKTTVAPLARRLRAAFDSAGIDRMARALRPGGRLGRRVRRPLDSPALDERMAADLTDLFRTDLKQLREIVGEDMDLWGIA